MHCYLIYTTKWICNDCNDYFNGCTCKNYKNILSLYITKYDIYIKCKFCKIIGCKTCLNYSIYTHSECLNIIYTLFKCICKYKIYLPIEIKQLILIKTNVSLKDLSLYFNNKILMKKNHLIL